MNTKKKILYCFLNENLEIRMYSMVVLLKQLIHLNTLVQFLIIKGPS